MMAWRKDYLSALYAQYEARDNMEVIMEKFGEKSKKYQKAQKAYEIAKKEAQDKEFFNRLENNAKEFWNEVKNLIHVKTYCDWWGNITCRGMILTWHKCWSRSGGCRYPCRGES